MAIFGTALLEDVEVLIGGVPYSGWESVSITKNLESFSGGFSVAVMDRWRELVEAWAIKPGDLCTVLIGGEPVISGWVDGIDTNFDKESRTITVKGRDKAADLVDCSIVTKESQFKDKTLTDIANALCAPFGISVTAETDVGKPFDKWDVTQGETVFENLEKAAKLRGVLLISDEFGNLKITRAGALRAIDSLIQGENILSAQATYDDSNRFSDYVVKGQKKGTDKKHGKDAAHNEDKANDAGVTRYRPLLVTAEGGADKDTAKGRAQWEATTRAGQAFRATIDVCGWRQSSGLLWKVNQLVFVSCGFAGVIGDLLISGITYEKSEDQGTVTHMELVRPDAFTPEPTVQAATDPSKKIGWSGSGGATGGASNPNLRGANTSAGLSPQAATPTPAPAPWWNNGIADAAKK